MGWKPQNEQTRGPLATSSTWETSSNQKTHLCKAITRQTDRVKPIYTPPKRSLGRGGGYKNICAQIWLYHNVYWESKTHFLLFENWMILICKTSSPLNPRMLCAKFGWTWPNWRRIFLNFVNVFSLLHHYLPLEKCVELNLNKLESWGHHLRMLCARFGWNWPSVSGEEDF